MKETTEEPVQMVARVCAIDIGKAGLVAVYGYHMPPDPTGGSKRSASMRR